MRSFLWLVVLAVVALGCSSIKKDKDVVDVPDVLDVADPGIDLAGEETTHPTDVQADEGTVADVPDVLDIIETVDADVPPSVLKHFGWFGPGGILKDQSGNVVGFGSLSGPAQAIQVPQN